MCSRQLLIFYGCFSLLFINSPLVLSIDFLNKEPASLPNNSTLQLVHLLFRHGPRTPVDTYPNDPYINEPLYPYGWGHLTNKGKMELFQLGKLLREKYADIMGDYFNNDLLRAQSTASPRTLMSMQTVLAGMFPPKNTPMQWSKALNWQPIPIYSEPTDQDIKLRMTAKCPRYDAAFEEVLTLPEVKSDLEQHAKLFEELTNITGLNITSAAAVNSLYITLLAEQAYGLKLPSWTKNYYPDQMEYMAAQHYIYIAYTTEMRRIKGGPFLTELVENMRSKAVGKLQPVNRRLFMYCAHDWSITNIMMALGLWRRQMPNFSALVAFELHRNPATLEYYVEIYFMNGASTKPQQLALNGCDLKCPLDKFIELNQDVLPKQTYDEMCRLLN